MLSNCVVLIGGTGRLEQLANQAAISASGARVIRAEVSDAATVCAELRPYAILVAKDVYEFGGSEFDALARDVDAGLLVVPEQIAAPVLSAALLEEAVRLG